MQSNISDTAVAQSNSMSKRDLVPIIVMMVGSFTAILNQTLMTSALPHLMHDFDITSNTAQWLSTVFMLTNGTMIPISAFLVQKFTTRQLFFYAVGMFLFGTLVCTAAPGLGVLRCASMAARRSSSSATMSSICSGSSASNAKNRLRSSMDMPACLKQQIVLMRLI